jgi:hypothetical protein
MIIRQIRPSRVWFWVAGALAGCAVVWFALSIITRAVLLALTVPTALFLGAIVLSVVVGVRRSQARRLPPIRISSVAGPAQARRTGSSGWLAHPSNRFQQPYWDGEAWVGHVADDAALTADSVPQPRQANPTRRF